MSTITRTLLYSTVVALSIAAPIFADDKLPEGAAMRLGSRRALRVPDLAGASRPRRELVALTETCRCTCLGAG